MTISTIFPPFSILFPLFFLPKIILRSLVFPYSSILLVIIHVMERTLGLLDGGSSGGGVGGTGLLSEQAALNPSKVEKEYMGMLNEAELELGLGLSSGGGGDVKGKGSSAWGECGRMLTAKDFPNGSSAGRSNGGAGVSAGTKRERAAANCGSEYGIGSASAAVSQVVGWPPVRTYKMNTMLREAKTLNVEEDKGLGTKEKEESAKKKINHGSDNKNNAMITESGHPGFVKVNVDGLPIGRKVDVNVHKSYETLVKALEEMFFKPSTTIFGSSEGKEQPIRPPKLLDRKSEYVITYEDGEGDWMLVGDVPWGVFLNMVKRLRIMRNF
ncbi:hypothetical protein Pfo_016222 [Paulownia fortunei]|nr:hypothetical protein Pfo_016222 [Paulownia fortunei]